MAVLEAAGAVSAREAAGADASGEPERAPGPLLRDERFWLLERLADNTGPTFVRDGVAGSLGLRRPGARAGRRRGRLAVRARRARRPRRRPGRRRRGPAALGHPSRLRILRHLLRGARTRGQLQEALPDAGTSGQLHHHLRELRAAGLVVSRRRNDYAVPAERVSPSS